MKKVLLDCDPGIDDSLAILLAVKSSELRVEAITTVSGNLSVDATSVNALKTLELAGVEDIPVSKGMSRPLVRPLPRDPFSHGDDGLGNTGLPYPRLQLDPRFGPDVIVETIDSFPGEITLVATGPLTNVAMAILKDPDIAKKVRRLITVAGAFGFNQYAYINATGVNPVSEWNVCVDPEATQVVFRSGMPITAIGLDVATHPSVNLRREHLVALKAAGTREARYVLDLVRFVRDREFQSYCVLIDSMAVAAAIDDTIVRTKQAHVDVETKGELTLGQTVVDMRANFRWDDMPQIDAAYDADFERFLDLLVQAVTNQN